MTYSLEFDARALKEWQKLGDTVRQQLKKKLAEVLLNPRIEANRLHSLPDCYKIKLRSSGYRLVYQVIDHEVWCLWSRLIVVSVSRLIGRLPSASSSQLIAVPVILKKFSKPATGGHSVDLGTWLRYSVLADCQFRSWLEACLQHVRCLTEM